jgi:Fe/S biogenesis protein NfuA
VANDTTGERVPTPVLHVTPAARALVAEARAGEADPERLALFVEVSGVSSGSYTYEMWFEALADATSADVVQHHDDVPVVIAAGSVDKLRGATLDVGEGGLVMVNPNTPPPAPGSVEVPESDLSSPLERAVLAVLDEEVNPRIAMHGGRADLVAVDEGGVAYLRLSGGCQGCGLAQVTLSQGIAVAIREAVPEITDVVDVTAHAQGTNPYFQPAKK